jgi:hypothetical protein
MLRYVRNLASQFQTPYGGPDLWTDISPYYFLFRVAIPGYKQRRTTTRLKNFVLWASEADGRYSIGGRWNLNMAYAKLLSVDKGVPYFI